MKNDLGKVDGRDKHQEDKKIKINKKLTNILPSVPLAINPGSSLDKWRDKLCHYGNTTHP